MTRAEAIIPPAALDHFKAFKQEIERALPDQVVGVTLFGSRARGDAEEDSDYDVAVFVRAYSGGSHVSSVLSRAAYTHMLEGDYISPVALPKDYLHPISGQTALAEDIERDGIVLG